MIGVAMECVLRPMIAIGSILSLSGGLVAQENGAAARPGFTIEVGMPIADVERGLADRRIRFVEKPRDVIKTNEDVADFDFSLDKNNVSAWICSSKSAKTVTSITLDVASRHGKEVAVWMRAKRITLENDGSYSVHFLPPVKNDQPQPQSVYPK
jgi:hypothetical protein